MRGSVQLCGGSYVNALTCSGSNSSPYLFLMPEVCGGHCFDVSVKVAVGDPNLLGSLQLSSSVCEEELSL